MHPNAYRRFQLLGGVSLALTACLGGTQEQARTVKGRMQPRPGAPMEDMEVKVHEAPVNPPSVPAAEANLPEDDLILGVVVDGEAMAYPIRYLATTEILDDRVGDTLLAPSW